MDDFPWVSGTNPIRKQSPLAPMSMQRLPAKSPPGIGRPGGNVGDNREPPLGSTSRVTFDPVDQLPLRRSRADTMPASSFPYGPNDLYTNLAVPVQHSSRHRSGSMTLPADRPDLSLYSQEYSPFDSPTATDDSVSNTVASTLASLGLDDENTQQATLTETISRNRAYTVAGRAPSVLDQPDYGSLGNVPFSPFSPRTRSSVLQRPRAISLGMADGATTVEPPPPGFGQYEFGASSMQHFVQPPRLQQPAIPIIPTSESQRTLRGSRSSGNLLDLNQEAFGHRPIGRMGSHNQLGRLPEMTAAKDFYTTFPMPSASSSSSAAVDSPPSAPAQVPSRALWLGNINPSLNVPDLMQLFSDYGHVESARILSDKECAFVNFSNVESAVAAKTDLETRLGNMLAGTPVRVGFGKADVNIAMALTNEAGPNAQGPTRALWVGNIPANMNPAILRSIFQPFGPIESVRVLSHKNCGFVNFEHQEDAVRARKSLQNKEILGPGTGTVRIGFAKVPANNADESDDANNSSQQAMPTPDNYQATQWATAMMMSKMLMQTSENQDEQPDLQTAIDAERRFIMQQLGVDVPEGFQDSSHFEYSSNIRPLPESDAEVRLEVQRLREIKKQLESGPITPELAEDIAAECSDVIVDLCSDYIGNTIVQRIFENCSNETKQNLLEKIAPYLPSIGVHKNGTWAAQKIIDNSTLPLQVQMIRENIEPYIPTLLLDQFGNYVVQCCLHMGTDKNKFVFDAIVDKCWEIGQGRFGSRAVRAILDSSSVTKEQKAYVASSIVQNAVLLSTQTNGAILLNWFLDSAEFPGRYRALCPRLLPYLANLCAHKLGSSSVFKIIQQTEDASTRDMMLAAIFNDSNVLDDILKDQVHGVAFLQKVLEVPDLPKRENIEQQLKDALARRLKVQNAQGYKKLIDQLGLSSLEESILRSSGSPVVSSIDNNGNKTNKTQDENSWTQNPQAVAMMANMYAAAMTAAATATQMQQKTSNIDIAQFDKLLKALLQQQAGGQQESDNQQQAEEATKSSEPKSDG